MKKTKQKQTVITNILFFFSGNWEKKRNFIQMHEKLFVLFELNRQESWNKDGVHEYVTQSMLGCMQWFAPAAVQTVKQEAGVFNSKASWSGTP